MAWAVYCVRCMACGHEWVAVCPTETALPFECSSCHEMTGAAIDQAEMRGNRQTVG